MRCLMLFAAALAVCLVGCQTGGNAYFAKPEIPSYPALTDVFDTSARLVVCGTDAEARASLYGRLQSCRYPVETRGTDSLAGEIVQPDIVIFILACDFQDYGCPPGERWSYGCHLRVYVRPTMRTALGAEPKAVKGEEFEAWSIATVNPPHFKMKDGQYVVEDGALVKELDAQDRRKLIDQACANLMNVEGFRRALERK